MELASSQKRRAEEAQTLGFSRLSTVRRFEGLKSGIRSGRAGGKILTMMPCIENGGLTVTIGLGKSVHGLRDGLKSISVQE